MSRHKSRLSIIIPTFDRADYLWATVEDLLRQDFTEFELLIIDQSPEATPVPNDPRVHYYRVPPIGPLAGINEGIERACGEIILILNDDVTLGRFELFGCAYVLLSGSESSVEWVAASWIECSGPIPVEFNARSPGQDGRLKILLETALGS